jgi:RND family efflux transporter MFP subunit
MKRALQILLPVGILGLAVGITTLMIVFRKEPERRQFQAPPREVVARTLERENYQIILHSQGSVQARTTSNLIPEVRGRIVSIGDNFQAGAFFEEGEVLIEIEKADYEAELIVAEANFAQAELRLFEEEARAEQAKRDWERLNPGVAANRLTLREPQLKQAAAAAASAAARVRTAQLNLDRTSLRAPYAGRVLTKNVDVGQFLSPGNQLARVFAVDVAEVRLPLTATQFAHLELPSVYRGENPTFAEGPPLTLNLEIAGEQHQWRGRIVRAEGAVDARSRQLFVVAQIRNPYGRTAQGRPPLKIGSFVEAEIEGEVLQDVFVVPRSLIRENSYLLLVHSDEQGDVLRRRNVNIVWQTDEVAVINGGLEAGEKLCLTQVPMALENYPVSAVPEIEAPSAVVDETASMKSRGPPRTTTTGRGPGGLVEALLAAIPPDRPLPPQLQTQLDAAIAAAQSGNRAALRPVMSEIRAWAEANDIELPAGRGDR